MRELNTTEVAQVSGAGHIAAISQYVGLNVGRLFGLSSFGERVGETVGAMLELIPGSRLINSILGAFIPDPKPENPKPENPEAEGK